MPDPNTSASKEVAIPIAVAALYNTSVFYLRSRDMYNTTYMHAYSVQLGGAVYTLSKQKIFPQTK